MDNWMRGADIFIAIMMVENAASASEHIGWWAGPVSILMALAMCILATKA